MEHDQLQTEEDFGIDARSARIGAEILHHLPHEGEIEPLLKTSIEVVFWDEIFEGDVLGQRAKVALLRPIMVAPPAGTDPESNATDHSVPVSSTSLGRTRVFQQPGKLGGYRCRPSRGCCRVHLYPSNRGPHYGRPWLPPRYPAGRDQRRGRQGQQKDEPSHPTPLSSSRAYDPHPSGRTTGFGEGYASPSN
jgi:hypothetical protein